MDLARRLQDDGNVTICAADAEKCKAEGGFAIPAWASWPLIIVLVMMSGLFSGLTLGLMGLDPIGLQIVQNSDNKQLAACAAKIAPVRAKGNQLLCTLLLGNVAVNSALSIISADIFSGTVGFVLSTALIVIFGEIIPQAACSRYALQVGSVTVPLVKLLMILFFLLTYPIAFLLDYVLGQEIGQIYTASELLEMMKLQIRLGATDEATGQFAQQVAEGALSFRDKKADEVMTPLEDSYMLATETILGYGMIREIFETGFSRIPVYGRDKNDYRGLLYSKDLMLADPEDEMKLGEFIKIFNRKVECFQKDTKLVEVLSRFKTSGTHMGLVREVNMEQSTDPRFEICGVITMEDIMEEILQDEIVDETDVYVDVDNHVKVNDGRDRRRLNLGVFNPEYRLKMNDTLSSEEVAAIASHLERTVFQPESVLKLGKVAIEWLVSTSEVHNLSRSTPLGTDNLQATTPEIQILQEADKLYGKGRASQNCTLVLQGRLRLRVGQDELPSEAGSFSVLAREALSDTSYVPDFSAYVGTSKVRLLYMSRDGVDKAKLLEQEPEKLKAEVEKQQSRQAELEAPRMDANPSMKGSRSVRTAVSSGGTTKGTRKQSFN